MRGFSPRRKCLLSEPLTQPSWLSAAELPSPTRGEGIAIGIVGNSLLTIPLAYQTWKGLKAHYDSPYQLMSYLGKNVNLHLFTGVLLVIGVLLGILVRR